MVHGVFVWYIFIYFLDFHRLYSSRASVSDFCFYDLIFSPTVQKRPESLNIQWLFIIDRTFAPRFKSYIIVYSAINLNKFKYSGSQWLNLFFISSTSDSHFSYFPVVITKWKQLVKSLCQENICLRAGHKWPSQSPTSAKHKLLHLPFISPPFFQYPARFSGFCLSLSFISTPQTFQLVLKSRKYWIYNDKYWTIRCS